jgi:membrane protease subunit HflC
MNQESGSSLKKIITLILVLVLFFIVLTCFYQVRITEKAVLTTFEKPVATVTEAGLHFKWPWPVQKVYTFDTRTRIYQSPYTEYLVQDGFNVVVRVFACWSIDNVDLYKNRVGVTAVSGESKISKLVDKYLRIVLSNHPLSGMVGVGDQNRFSKVEDEILQMVGKEAMDQYGIKVETLGFDRLELPEDTTSAVFDRMKSERMKMVEKILSEGKLEAENIRRKAEAQKSMILAEAEAEAARIRGEADTKAFEYLDVYNQHPDFALFLKKLQALEETMKTKTTIVIDKDTPPFDMLSPEKSELKK